MTEVWFENGPAAGGMMEWSGSLPIAVSVVERPGDFWREEQGLAPRIRMALYTPIVFTLEAGEMGHRGHYDSIHPEARGKTPARFAGWSDE